MKNSKLWLLGTLASLTLLGCDREEIPITAHEPGEVQTVNVSVGGDYRWQVYYDLGTQRMVSQVRKINWDLGFQTGIEGNKVILNGAKAMFVDDRTGVAFEDVMDTVGMGVRKKWDVPSGNLDSTAIGDWQDGTHIYVIDRGYSETGAHQGLRKIQILGVDNDAFQVRIARLNNTEDTTLFVQKDPAYNYAFLSLNNGGAQVDVEPPKADWDLNFTQYTHIFHDPVMPYLVTGCLSNAHQTFVAIDSVKTFDQIDIDDINSYTFSPALDAIGYSWKVFTGVTYITLPHINYIIQDQEGHYYKLHFIDFYDDGGVKGSPKWEQQRL